MVNNPINRNKTNN